jgi:hypothetical protein
MGLSDNQEISVTAQLDLGVRFLQGQTHDDDRGVLSMCHTSCRLENAGSLESYLDTVKDWLDANPNEVVTLLITNGDRADMSRFDEAFIASGAKDIVYIPSTSPRWLPMNSWPTLGEFIDSGKRLIVFIGMSSALPDRNIVFHLISHSQTTTQTCRGTRISWTSFCITSRLPLKTPTRTSTSAISTVHRARIPLTDYIWSIITCR